MLMCRYVSSLYYVTTTATTVGYGDITPKNRHEKLFNVFLEFIGICTFSLITGRILGLKSSISLEEVISQKVSQ